RGGALQSVIRENKWFFVPFGLFLVLGAILLSVLNTGDAIFFFSAHRSYWGDLFFRYFTKMGEAPAYFLVLGALLFVGFRHVAALPVLGFLVGLLSFLSKELFSHDRPYLFFRKMGVFDQIHTVEGVVLNGGNNSFPSGHTMSAFALYAFLALCLPRKGGVGLLLFLAALLVGVSRIYLVQHFFKDVYLGAFLGVLAALAVYFLQYRMDAPWMGRKLNINWKGKPKVRRQAYRDVH
ncbi:MAG: phosphatase PAP2 family protein, partial [Phaeodactylibacter sp.]|nr:phosphatase PAP2 family protein [Phaeodactylibacter sp.]